MECMMSASVPVASLEALKQLSKEFIKDGLPTANEEQAQAGFKCFALGYLGFEPRTAVERVEAVAIYRIVSRLYMEHMEHKGWSPV